VASFTPGWRGTGGIIGAEDDNPASSSGGSDRSLRLYGMQMHDRRDRRHEISRSTGIL